MTRTHWIAVALVAAGLAGCNPSDRKDRTSGDMQSGATSGTTTTDTSSAGGTSGATSGATADTSMRGARDTSMKATHDTSMKSMHDSTMKGRRHRGDSSRSSSRP